MGIIEGEEGAVNKTIRGAITILTYCKLIQSLSVATKDGGREIESRIFFRI